MSAKEAAKAVAENWNPGLTFSQQKDAAYKVADAVYNNAGVSRRMPQKTRCHQVFKDRSSRRFDRILF